MRVVFLDVDGVLNSVMAHLRMTDADDKEGFVDGMIGIDPVHVAFLNQLLERSGAQVVLSSTWRIPRMYGPGKTLGYLKRRGYTGPDFIGATPDLLCHPRGDEIQSWLNAWPESVRGRKAGPVESFVILDDTDDMAHLKHRLVQTTWQDGLGQEHVDRALTLFETPPT